MQLTNYVIVFLANCLILVCLVKLLLLLVFTMLICFFTNSLILACIVTTCTVIFQLTLYLQNNVCIVFLNVPLPSIMPPALRVIPNK